MFCKNCGKEISDNVQFCKYCGKEIVTTTNEEEFINNNNVKSDSSVLSENMNEKDTILNNSEHIIKGRWIMKIAAVIVIACFFFPMFTVSCAGVNMTSVSMVDIFAGIDQTDDTGYYSDYIYSSNEEDKSDGADGMIVYLVAPAIALVLCMRKKSKKGCEQDAVAVFIASALALILQYIYMNSQIVDVYEYIQIRPLFTYYLYIIACAIGAFTGIIIAKERQMVGIDDEQMSKYITIKLLIKTILMSLGGTFAMLAIYYLLNDL